MKLQIFALLIANFAIAKQLKTTWVDECSQIVDEDLYIYCDFSIVKQFNEHTKLVVLTVLCTYIQTITMYGTLENQHNL